MKIIMKLIIINYEITTEQYLTQGPLLFLIEIIFVHLRSEEDSPCGYFSQPRLWRSFGFQSKLSVFQGMSSDTTCSHRDFTVSGSSSSSNSHDDTQATSHTP